MCARKDKSEPPYEDEIVYKDNEGAICRCWNWRESVRTMLTENTKNAFLCIELIDEKRTEEFENALNYLAILIYNIYKRCNRCIRCLIKIEKGRGN